MVKDFIAALIEQAEAVVEDKNTQQEAALKLYEFFVDAGPLHGAADSHTWLNVASRLDIFFARRFREIVQGNKLGDALLLQ